MLEQYGSAPESLLVTDVVLAEAVWVLRSAYSQDKAAQLLAIHSLLQETAFAFEDRKVMERATELFEQSACGFSDCLIAARHAQRGCEFTATLDRRMGKLPCVRVI